MTREEVILLNNSSAAAKAAGLGTKLNAASLGELPAGSVSAAELATNSVTTAKLAANSVSLAKISLGLSVGVAVDDARTTSREENIAGLSSAILLANSLKTVMNAHAADGAGGLHVNADTTNFPVTTTNAINLTTLLALSGALLTAYDVHDDDSELGAAWLYHDAQEAGDHSPVSAVTPVTLQEAITRLNDLKAKYNAHDADGTTHTSGSSANQEATADAAYGAAVLIPVATAVTGDTVTWAILDSGTGTVTGVSAVAGTGGITVTFSADPQNDAIIMYSVFREAT